MKNEKEMRKYYKCEERMGKIKFDRVGKKVLHALTKTLNSIRILGIVNKINV